MGRAAVLSVWLVGACGGAAPGGADAGADAATDAEMVVAAPARPVLVPCPEGWSEVADPEAPFCEPWPASGPEACAADEGHFPGEPGCARIGTECPADGVPVDLPSDGVVLHVREGAAGDGTLAAPFGTVTEANSAAGPGTTVALAVGSYDEVVRARGDVTLVGACVAGTRLTATAPAAEPTDAVVGVHRPGTVAIANLTISEALRTGVYAGGTSSTVELRDVVFDRTTYAGVITALADLVATRVLVRDIAPGGSGAGGVGMLAQYGDVELADVAVRRTRRIGLIVTEAPRVVLRGVAVSETAPEAYDGSAGRGLQIIGAGDVSVERIAVESTFDVGAMIGADSVTLEDLIIRGVMADEVAGDRGRGLDVVQTPAMVGRRIHVADITTGGVLLSDGVAGTVSDVIIRRAVSRSVDGTWGRGLDVQRESDVTLERALVEDVREMGVVANEATVLRARDLTVRGVVSRACAATTCASEPLGYGVGAFRRSALAMERFEVHGSAICGLQLALEGEADLADGVVSGSPIGACVQVEGYDTGRLRERVLYRDNTTNLDITELPVPDAS